MGRFKNVHGYVISDEITDMLKSFGYEPGKENGVVGLRTICKAGEDYVIICISDQQIYAELNYSYGGKGGTYITDISDVSTVAELEQLLDDVYEYFRIGE